MHRPQKRPGTSSVDIPPGNADFARPGEIGRKKGRQLRGLYPKGTVANLRDVRKNRYWERICFAGVWSLGAPLEGNGEGVRDSR